MSVYNLVLRFDSQSYKITTSAVSEEEAISNARYKLAKHLSSQYPLRYGRSHKMVNNNFTKQTLQIVINPEDFSRRSGVTLK